MAKTIQVAFFKAAYGSILSKTIKVVTQSEYSHVELIIKDTWYGSNVNLLGTSGITKIHKPIIKPHEWTIVDIKVSDKQYKEILSTANSLVGSGYAFMAAIKSQFSSLNVTTQDEFFCSQFIAYILKKHKVLHFVKNEASKYDPGSLMSELNNKIKFTSKKNKILEFSKLQSKSFSLEELYLQW